MRDFIKLPLVLFLVALIAGMILGVTNYLTKEPIRMQHEMALRNAREELFPDSEFITLEELSLSEENDNVIAVYESQKDGILVGYIVTMEKTGYAGAILLNYGITIDGMITGVNVGTNSETPGLGAKASDVEFTGQFIGKKNVTLVKGTAIADDEISAITAATITSQAVVDGVNQAIVVSDLVMEK
ncbi:MAG: RnfABCDGE type electron transport complex subunit G [Clostridiales bacterium]|nr:RnfABCDGE type electron transport complex subunit G [Clostridiales bacterium]